MTPGTILFDTHFEFDDGAVGRKLLVLLNDGTCGFYITLKTTSNPKHKGRKAGCQSRDRYPNFFVPDGSSDLRGDSWLMLREFKELTAPQLLQKKFSGIARHIGVLPKEMLIQLLECALAGDDLSTQQEEVLRATLQHIKEPEPPLLELVKPPPKTQA